PHGPRRATALLRHVVLLAPPSSNTPLAHREHSAEAPARVVPATRRKLGQSRLRVGLAGAGCAGDPRGDRTTSVARAARADEGTDPERERRGPRQVTDVKASP